jgi:hypothetical protein
MTIPRVPSSVSAAILTRFTTALLAGCATLLMIASPVLAAPNEESLLLGDGLTHEQGVAYNPKEESAQEWTATRSGAIQSIRWYSPSDGWRACKLVGEIVCPSTIERAGIWEDRGGKPGTVLGETAVHVGLPVIGNWNSIPLAAPVSVTAGRHYWLAYIGENGFLVIAYHGSPGGSLNFGSFIGSTETITTTNEWRPEQEGFENGPLATAAYGSPALASASRPAPSHR